MKTCLFLDNERIFDEPVKRKRPQAGLDTSAVRRTARPAAA